LCSTDTELMYDALAGLQQGFPQIRIKNDELPRWP
jgi:hypothetical protein